MSRITIANDFAEMSAMYRVNLFQTIDLLLKMQPTDKKVAEELKRRHNSVLRELDGLEKSIEYAAGWIIQGNIEKAAKTIAAELDVDGYPE